MANNIPHNVGMVFCNVAYKANQKPLKKQLIDAKHRYDSVGLQTDSLSISWERQRQKIQIQGCPCILISLFGCTIQYLSNIRLIGEYGRGQNWAYSNIGVVRYKMFHYNWYFIVATNLQLIMTCCYVDSFLIYICFSYYSIFFRKLCYIVRFADSQLYATLKRGAWM